jgi:hypothetical protein
MTNIIENSLVDYLKLLKPDIPPQLISSENWSKIEKVAGILPRAITSFFGFECHLGIEEPHADFLICADAKEAGRKILAEENYSIALPDFLMQHPVWNQIRDFSSTWNTDTSPLFKQVNNVWLEFDIDRIPTIPVPSCFFGSNPIYSKHSIENNNSDDLHPYQWISQSALSSLLARNIPTKVEQKLFQCFDLLPEGAYVFQIGVMLARQSDLVRICIRNISPTQIVDYLTQINWQGSIVELKNVLDPLSNFVDRIDLDIDVGEVILPKIGLECYLKNQPDFEPRWQLFLNHLVEMGLCLPQKRNALLDYPGYIRESRDRELWPTNLLKLSSFLGEQSERVLFRGLHHIKVVYQSEPPFEGKQPLQAKAYLYASQNLMTPDTVSQWKSLPAANA